MAEAHVAIAGAEAVLDPAGALWLPESRTLVVADLHLEKASSFARRGMFLPPYDTARDAGAARASSSRGATRARVDLPRRQLPRWRRLRPARRDRPRAPRGAAARARLDLGRRQPRPRRCRAASAARSSPSSRCDGLVFRHEPRAGAGAGEVAGHLHPAAKVRGRGALGALPRLRHRRTAHGPAGLRRATGGLNVLDRAFAPLFAGGLMRAFLIGAGRHLSGRLRRRSRPTSGSSRPPEDRRRPSQPVKSASATQTSP